jgi:hypothetical protein
MFGDIFRAPKNLFKGTTKQLKNFGGLLTGQNTPGQFMDNSIGNFTDQVTSGFGWLNNNNKQSRNRNTGAGRPTGDALNQQNIANQNQFQAQNQRQFDQNNNLANPFNQIQGGFSNMLTGGNWAPGQKPDYLRMTGKERPNGFLGNPANDPQVWR